MHACKEIIFQKERLQSTHIQLHVRHHFIYSEEEKKLFLRQALMLHTNFYTPYEKNCNFLVTYIIKNC